MVHARPHPVPGAGALEALILSDGSARFAVPISVIERYRLADDELVDAARAPADQGDPDRYPAWTVQGASYALDELGPGTGIRSPLGFSSRPG